MNALAKALTAGALTAMAALGIVWVITLLRGASLLGAISRPGFWVVEGAAIIIAIVVVGTASDDEPRTERPPLVRTATHAISAAIAAIVVGVLVAVAIETPTLRLLTSLKFLVPAGIATAVAALEAWPTGHDQHD